MNSICRDIFRAIHEGKWLSIEYKNKDNKVTKYWIGIKSINPISKSLTVDGLHLSFYTVKELNIYVDSIISSSMVDGSYQPINKELIEDIYINPHKYQTLFHNVANLKILNYLADCNKLDAIPYKTDFALISCLDNDKLTPEGYILDKAQFKQIVDNFQYKSTNNQNKNNIQQLCVNILSVNTPKGLYVLAYKKLNLDVKQRMLTPHDEITVCKEFTIAGEKQSIRQFLDAEDYYLLDNFEENQELIKDKVTSSNKHFNGVDDMPYIIAVGIKNLIDLNVEYAAIVDEYEDNSAPVPIKAFFGDITDRPRRYKEYPIALLNKRINLDQLLAINNAMKYPVAYIQGPPGTGKTNTIINTITTAFFNDRTVLFSSYNNHPIDGVFKVLSGIEYNGKTVPFPILRLGNNEKVLETTEYIKELYNRTKALTIFDKTLEKDKENRTERTKKLAELLKKHEERIDLNEKKEAIEQLMSSNNQMIFQTDLSSRQLYRINKEIAEIGDIKDEDALALLTDDEENFKKYLFYTSAKFIKRLSEPKYSDFLKILDIDDKNDRISEFNKYISDNENFIKLMRVFPIIATTCISAHKIGEPKPYFDMVIIDEASQCNTAVSLVPIIRGNNLMLVGDPQQLNPVILLDGAYNAALRKKYSVAKEYDYIENSIYKTYLGCDAVSDEILLSHHYRCNKKIIDFNNKKYYNGKLNINTQSRSDKPLVFCDIKGNTTTYKNTAPIEAEKIIQYAKLNKDKSIGVITPFVNQKELITSSLKENGLNNVTCGTVHAFQGDEKDVVLFSLAITDKTHQGTYEWLKNNKELINVATSRAKEKLVILSDIKELERLHKNQPDDDLYELVQYVRTNGETEVSSKEVNSRALGIKPYSTETEEAFMTTLNHALDNILYYNTKCIIKKEVAISHVFSENISQSDLFYSGRFDFVVYEKQGRQELPILAIELDGKEHYENDVVKMRDKKKNEICRKHGFELIRVENSYARRYNYIKDVLIDYFGNVRAQ